jgi:Flp pilus assembly protein TadD
MPTTINGIGTHYYGKRNLQVRHGTCDQCKRPGQLTSYETRLWFVVVFIPVIPLGRKQIVDQCPHCTRHRAASLGEFKRAGEQAVEEARRHAQQHPGDPDVAVRLHATLVAFQQREESHEQARAMEARFPDHAGVQMYLGAWHSQEGREDEADARFERALAIEPDNHAAARAVAVGCMQKGDLARARDLLAFMQTPGPDQDPAVMVMLADAYQAGDDHQSALWWYRLALEGSPPLAADRKLRKRIKRSEAALGRTQSVVGEVPGARRRRLTWAAVVVGLVAIPLLVNHYMASRQMLHVVNRLPGQVTVTIDGRGEGTVVGQGREAIPIVEGTHQAAIRRQDGAETTVDFEIQNSLWQRFTGDSVFVLNPGGAADLIWEEAVYTATPDPNAEGRYRIHFGEEFVVFRDVDYAFEEFPNQISTESSRVVKSRVGVIGAPPAAVLSGFPKGTPPDELLRFVEHHLDVVPSDGSLMRIYYAMCVGTDQTGRCRDFLAKGISRKPVAIEWHRTYQETARSAAETEAMIAEYDRLLEEAPDNSALLYLRGRLATRASEEAAYFDRAIAADPENAYPLYAKGYNLTSKGQLAEAKERVAEACRLQPDHPDMADVLFEIRFGLGEYSDLEKELREALRSVPTNLDLQKRLLRVLVASGQAPAAADAHAAFSRQLDRAVRPDAEALRLGSLMALQYYTGDLESCLETVGKDRNPEQVKAAAAALRLELGRPDEAEDVLGVQGPFAGYHALLLSLGWRLKGDEAKADAWRENAIEAFASEGREQALVAGLLRKGDRLDMSDVDDLTLPREVSAAVLVALAEAGPDCREQLLDRAEKLNHLGPFPHFLLKRAIAAMRG